MRKNALALSIATLIGGLGFVGAASADVVVGTGAPTATTLGATTATAMSFSAGGIGHALLIPYFNAQNGNATIFSVTNTDTNNGKVMKVRFRGASNSDDILDFTVLMSPGDVWNATITASGGVAQILTNDRSCTLPQLAPGVAQPFVTNRLTNKPPADTASNTREGYVEIFNMADIPSASVYGAAANAQSALYTATKHVNGAAPPCTSAAINAAILNTNHTTEASAAGQGLATPTTGLYGNFVIINVPQTTTYSGEMVAVRATVGAGGVDGRANFVVFPQSATAYGAGIDNVTADPLLRTSAFTTKTPAGVGGGATAAPAISAAFYDLPDMSTPYVTAPGAATAPLDQAASLTAALAVNAIVNDYATDSIVTAKTDWVFSMPTRRYSVAMDYAPTTSRRLYSLVPSAGNQYFHDGNTAINPLNSQQICVSATAQTFYDREEQTRASGAVFSPGNISVTQFCGETSVLSFGDASGPSVLGALVARQDTGASAFVNGWGNVNVQNGATGLGLPVIGSAFIKLSNPNAVPGTSGTYGISSEHRFTR